MVKPTTLILLTTFLAITACSRKEDNNITQAGKEIYIANCVTCHGENGEGIAGTYPSLLRPSGFPEAQTARTVQLIRSGSPSENGMKPIPLSNEEITSVINYIQNSWGNEAPAFTIAQVEAVHKP